ncbi:hypothetical protein ACLOJK_001194 [Asimina triloba]
MDYQTLCEIFCLIGVELVSLSTIHYSLGDDAIVWEKAAVAKENKSISLQVYVKFQDDGGRRWPKTLGTSSSKRLAAQAKISRGMSKTQDVRGALTD